jgi:hypothetical protein
MYGQYQEVDAEQREYKRRLGDAGVAGWNDFGPVPAAARKALKQAAGITIPERDFVLKVLLGYLVVLVPLNWGLFRLLGRVEWAWVAAPLIAIVCGVLVVRLAQLDIGFTRSSTEIAVVELHDGYPRAHVTRYTALYTSLSTTYAAHFDDQPAALALPFSTNPAFEMLTGQSQSTVNYRRDSGAHLTGYGVSSNATGMLHSEHMLDLPGGLTYEDDGQNPPRVINATGLPLRDVGVVRRSADGSVNEIAWIGDLPANKSAGLEFDAADDNLFAHRREQSPQTAHVHPPDTLSLRSLVDLAEHPARLAPGDVRLIARLDDAVPGMRIEPTAAQARYATMVVAHLRLAAPTVPAPDTNLLQQAKRVEELLQVDDTEPMPDDME